MDMEALMAQAQALQEKVAVAQEQLGATVIKGLAENGACIVDMTGKYDVLNITIKPEILGRDVTDVQEIILAAFRDAKTKADKLIDSVMGAATAGMPMPK